MIDTGKLTQSIATIRIYEGTDQYNRTGYPSAGVYYHHATQYYYIVGDVVYGVPKALFEEVFIEVDPKPISVGVDGIKDEIFLKTVALLSGRASEFKDL